MGITVIINALKHNEPIKEVYVGWYTNTFNRKLTHSIPNFLVCNSILEILDLLSNRIGWWMYYYNFRVIKK